MQRHGKETGGKAKKRTGGEPGRRDWGGGEKRECGSAGLAEVFDPANEDPVIGGFDIEEFHADADTRLNNADDPEGFDGLFFVAKGNAHAGFQRQGLAGADETASHRDIGGDADGASAGFEVKKLGVKAIPILADVTRFAELERMASEVVAKLGAIDILVNNAGIIAVGPVSDFAEDA